MGEAKRRREATAAGRPWRGDATSKTPEVVPEVVQSAEVVRSPGEVRSEAVTVLLEGPEADRLSEMVRDSGGPGRMLVVGRPGDETRDLLYQLSRLPLDHFTQPIVVQVPGRNVRKTRFFLRK